MNKRQEGDWRWQLRHMAEGLDPALVQLCGDVSELAAVHARYPVRVSPYFLGLLDPGNPRDPLNLQALPSIRELEDAPGAVADPFGETGAVAVSRGVLQRFPDRVLILAHDRCALACRHCTRKGLLAAGVRTAIAPADRAAAIAWIRAHPRVREALISGGDPLLLADRPLLALVRALAGLRQLDAVRIGTRVPATLPMRVTPELAKELGAFGKVWVNTQFNHARELTPEAVAACGRLADAGVPLSNQSVLLRGVNDSADALFDLCAALQRARVRPYYVFQCDPVAGTRRFRVSDRRARAIARELARRIGGLALPRFVRDVPGAPCKLPV